MTAQTQELTARIKYLDGTRALAALIVILFHHTEYLSNIGIVSNNTKLYSWFIFNGPLAVAFFFVLSGLAISFKTYSTGVTEKYWKFVVKRFFRIFPVYIGILIIGFFITDAKLSVFLKELFLIPSNGFNFQILGATWALCIIFYYSLIGPFLIKVINHLKTFDLYFFLLAFISILFIPIPGVVFLIHFSVGVLISKYFNSIRDNTIPFLKKVLLLALSVLLFSIRWLSELYPKIQEYISNFINTFHLHDSLIFDYAEGISAGILIILLINSKNLHKFLENKFLLKMGTVSYVIYLSNGPILHSLYIYWDGFRSKLPEEIFILSTTIVNLVATVLFSLMIVRFIEKPFIKLSKRILDNFRYPQINTPK